jgi:raffinose/stachyose/melibiose transport system substrate-binding protein
MFTRRVVLAKAMGLIALFTLLFSACQGISPAPAQSSNAESTSEASPVTLAVWWISSSPEYAETVRKLFDAYQEQHPLITIESTFYSYGDYVAAMGPALEAHQPPDLAFSDPSAPALPNYIEAGHIIDLTEIAAERGWAERLTPGMLDFYRPIHQGKVYGAPFNIALRGFFYNKEIMQKIGGQTPTTLAELDGLAQKAKEAGFVPFGLGNQTNWSSEYYWLNTAYGHLAAGDWQTFYNQSMGCQPGAAWSGDAVRKGIEQLVAWEQAGYFNEGYNAIGETDVHLEFAKGNMLAYYYNAASQNVALKNDAPGFEIGFFNFPAVTPQTPLLSMTDPGNVMIVPKESAHVDEALDLLNWLLDAEVGRTLAESGIIPAHKTDFSAVQLPVPWMADELKLAADQTPVGWLNWAVPGLGDVTGPEVQRILAGETTIDDALAQFQAKYDEACGG